MDHRQNSALFMCVLLGCGILSLAQGQDSHWPQFRGTNAGVAASASKPPVTFGPSKNVLWKRPLSAGDSSPCIWGDYIFLTSYEGKRLSTVCLRRSDGKILWQRLAPAKEIEHFHPRSGSPAASTPVTDGNRVYIYFGSFGLLAYDFRGNAIWSKPLPMAVTDFGTGSSPILADGLLLLNRDHKENSHLLAVDCNAGNIIWRVERPDFLTSYSTPIVWENEFAKEVIVPGSFRLKAYDLKDGRERWLLRDQPKNVCTTPVIGDGWLFVASWSTGSSNEPLPDFSTVLMRMDHNKDQELALAEVPPTLGRLRDFFSAIDRNNDRSITKEEWNKKTSLLKKGKNSLMAVRPGGAGDITETHVAWSYERDLPYVSSPLYYQGQLYLIKDGGITSTFVAKTGKLLYRERLGASGNYYASPIAANGKIYVCSLKGVVVVFASGDTFTVVARNKFDEAIAATPAVVNDILYLRTAKNLYAFAERTD